MRLHIFGASGVGVTTLGMAYAARTGIPYFDSDDYFWEPTDPPFTVRRDAAMRNKMILDAMHPHEHWILGGSVINWGDELFPPFDLIVFLWIPQELRLQRSWNREYARYGEKLHNDPVQRKATADFMAWSADYDNNTGISKRTLAAHEEWMKKQSAPILELRGDLSTEARIDLIEQKIRALPLC